MNAPNDLGADSPELEALFDSIAQDQSGGAPAPAAEDTDGGNVLNRVGKLTRNLHDTLVALGYHKQLEECAAGAIPDARERLAYVVTMTEQAASRALNAIEIVQPLQNEMGSGAGSLALRWDALHRNELSVDEFKALAGETRDFLQAVPQKTRATEEQLREIMMAQDFQDLTGQVIKKITDLAQTMERQLLNLLAEHAPAEKRSEAGGLLNGPVVNSKGRTDVMTSQAQVDEFLESLGF